jgi:hypothetical protein
MDTNKKRILSVTGGSTKFIQLVVGMLKIYSTGYKPTDIIGISASSIAALPLVLGLHKEMIEEGLDVSLSDIFTQPPVNEKGKMSLWAVVRAILSYLPIKAFKHIHSFGHQDIRPLLTKYITEEMFIKYKNNESLPNIHVVGVLPRSGNPIVINLKNCNWKEALDAISLSSHIQLAAQAVKFNGSYWESKNNKRDDDNAWAIDGGMFCTAGAGGYLIEEGYFDKNEIESMVSLYSWDNPFKLPYSDAWKDNIFNNNIRLIDTLGAAIRYYSIKHEELLCKESNIKHLQLYVPNVLPLLYTVDRKLLETAKEKTELYIDSQILNSSFFK